MRLRRQLILLAGLTLILPWAALQYVSEMQSILRDGQLRAMTASAKAVAKMIASDGEYLAQLSHAVVAPQSDPLYAHPLLAAPIVDGYDDEWRYFPFQARTLGDRDASVHGNLQLAEYGSAYYAFVRVHDRDLHYHNPARDAVASGDHLVLRTRDLQGGPHTYFLSASAPGKAQVYQRTPGGKVEQEHRVRAFWQERVDGYQVEIQLPKSLAGAGMAVTLVSQSPGLPVTRLSTHPEQQPVPTVLQQQPDMTALLSVFSESDQRWMVLSSDHWVLADTGDFADQFDGASADQSVPAESAYGWLWRALLARPPLPAWREPAVTGQLVHPDSPSRDVLAQWFRTQDQLLALVLVPIYTGSQRAGFVGLVQSAQAQDAGTRQAMRRLLFYSVLAVLVLGGALLGYASWLSWRVQRLARAAEDALGEGGTIAHQLPDSRSQDELGGLSRTLSSLLVRLREYTQYLQTLSSKLSHELRTPLAVVKSSLDNLHLEMANSPTLGSASVYRERAQAGADRLSAILNAMSSASRLEESLAHSEPEQVDLAALVRDVAEAYSDSFARPIASRVGEGDFRVRLVPDLMVQLLDKLVENSVDFCPPTGQICIALERTATHVTLSVANDGPLLPASMQHQLFDSLVSVRPEGQGSHLGLGLHIVRLIAAFHGAQVAAANQPDGSGVVFTFTLPIS